MRIVLERAQASMNADSTKLDTSTSAVNALLKNWPADIGGALGDAAGRFARMADMLAAVTKERDELAAPVMTEIYLDFKDFEALYAALYHAKDALGNFILVKPKQADGCVVYDDLNLIVRPRNFMLMDPSPNMTIGTAVILDDS